jgi:hypothetical protein
MTLLLKFHDAIYFIYPEIVMYGYYILYRLMSVGKCGNVHAVSIWIVLICRRLSEWG